MSDVRHRLAAVRKNIPTNNSAGLSCRTIWKESRPPDFNGVRHFILSVLMISTELSEVHTHCRRRRVGRHERVQTLVGVCRYEVLFRGAAGEFTDPSVDAGVLILVTNGSPFADALSRARRSGGGGCRDHQVNLRWDCLIPTAVDPCDSLISVGSVKKMCHPCRYAREGRHSSIACR